jgi:polyferredoxin
MTNFVNRDKNDIFKNPFLAFLFKNKKFLFIFRVLVTLLFLYAIFYGFYNQDKTNTFTTTIFWGIFWSLFMVTTLASFGRIFCGICPHGFMGKFITKIGLKKTMPKWLQNRYIGLFILVIGWWTVYYFFDAFWKSSFNTALMFGILTLVSFFIYYLYKDMSYCKYICPIGTLTRAFDKISFTKLETYTEHCKSCKTFDCASACPYDLKPFTFAKKNQTDDCTLCMECANSCEAVKFKFTKPAEQLNSKLKILNIEIWSYILILACIPVSMTFAHGLNRSTIADQFIWNKFASFLGFTEYSGGFAFLFAIICTVFFSLLGLYLASKVLKKDFDSTFTTLGIAFIPLFIFSSLGHTWESFFVKDYEKIVEGLAQGFAVSLDVNSLAKRGDAWLHYFGLFKWIGIVWAFVLLYKRMKLIDSSKIRKIFAYLFASFVIIFLILITFYKDYILEKHGTTQMNHSSHSSKEMLQSVSKNENFSKKRENLKVENNPSEAFYFSITNPTMKRGRPTGGQESHGKGKPSNEIPSKNIWLVQGSLENQKIYSSKNLELFYFDINQKEEAINSVEDSYKFNVPNNGYYNLFAVEQNENYYKVSKLEYLHGKHGGEEVYDDKVKKELSQNKTKIDLIRIKNKEEDSFFYKFSMGDTLKFKAIFEDKPLVNEKIKIQLQSGWIKELRTNENGEVNIELIRDYFPSWEKFNKRFKQDFLISLEYKKDEINYVLTYPGSYFPNSLDYQSYAYGLVLTLVTLLISGIIIYRFRKNRTVPYKEAKYV